MARIDIPNILVDGYMWGDMLTNLTREKFPHMDMTKLEEGEYEVHVSLAGYKKEDISVSLEGNIMDIKGDWKTDAVEYLMHGIAKRKFHRQLPLHEHTKVTGVSMDNGILTIKLSRKVPEDKKPTTFEIE